MSANSQFGRSQAALGREFYCRDPQEVARDLLAKLLIRRTRGRMTVGRIVEVEAYLHEHDAACHASRGCTKSNRAMFGPPGRAYVYPIHSRYCLNAVTEAKGVPSAVLIRAVEPIAGLETMRRRRGREKLRELTRGPGRLCQAFAVDRGLDHWDLTAARRLWICEADAAPLAPDDVGRSVRIGVTSAHELPLRFFVKGNVYVSGPRIAAVDSNPKQGKRRTK